MSDPRIAFGLEVEPRVLAPYSIQPAARDGTGDDGGTLDRAIVARTEDGRRVVIGEIWAACLGKGGAKIRIDADAEAQFIVDTLNEAAVPSRGSRWVSDPRIALGFDVEAGVVGPYGIIPATRDGTGDDGGALDRAITAHTKDGRPVIIGEIWAAGHGKGGAKIRIDADGVALQIVHALNRAECR